jgi:hypothetical protein
MGGLMARINRLTREMAFHEAWGGPKALVAAMQAYHDATLADPDAPMPPNLMRYWTMIWLSAAAGKVVDAPEQWRRHVANPGKE